MSKTTTSHTVKTIYDLIHLIRLRPGMYIGDNKISTMSTFLQGYEFSTTVHDIKSEKVFPPFWYFHEYVTHKYNWYESTAGWKNIILEESGNDEEKALQTFFQIVDEFKALHPIGIEKALLGEQHLNFHHSDKCKIKYIDGKAIYERVDEIFLVQFSHNFGFSHFVLEQNKVHGLAYWNRFKDENSAKISIENLFGQVEWQTQTGDLKKALKAVM